jgi:predicted dehydrogenase
MGHGRLQYYAQMPDARVEAFADVRAGELRRDHSLEGLLKVPAAQVRWFEDYHELAASGVVDMVDICLPTGWHKDATVASLEGGLHVLCEKPMALTLADCDAMVGASRKASRLLMIAQCIRFWPEYEVLTRLYHSGEAGRLLSLQLTRQGPTPRNANSWMCQAEQSGGAILDLHIHDVDYCHYLLGLPRRVYAQGGMSEGPAHGYNYALTNLDYGDGLQACATTHWTDVPIPFVARYEARFERAFLHHDSGAKPSLLVYREGCKEPEAPELGEHDAYHNEIRYFLDCVLAGTAPTRCLPETARDSVALIKAATASIERRALVDCREFVS